MNTNDSQFLKVYNDLVIAFFNFMNVVNPQSRQQHNLSYVASQLNQLLNYLATEPQVATPTVQQQSLTAVTEDPVQNTTEMVQTPCVPNPTPQPTFNEGSAKLKYCAYPDLVNGRYKFKSGLISDNANEDSVYKLTVDEEAQVGFVEIINLTGNILKTVANNPSLYTPLGICPDAGSITSESKSVTSRSKLKLVKVVRGWEIVEGEKFALIVT